MPLSEVHSKKLEEAIKALHTRGHYEAFMEDPRSYPNDGQKLEELLGTNFSMMGEDAKDFLESSEKSPFTQQMLGVSYPFLNTSTLANQAEKAFEVWRKTSREERASLLMGSLDRIAKLFPLMAGATIHTTGQSSIMAFQASGPHSSDRALESLAIGYELLGRYPKHADWHKRVGKQEIHLKKNFVAKPYGIGLSIGCSTFPVWNSLPSIFANLISGNVSLHKAHPSAVLPIALVLNAIREEAIEQGFDPNIVQLAIDPKEGPRTKELAESPMVKLIDYTGGSPFGEYIESLKGKITFTEKSGVNPVLMRSSENLNATLGNLAFSLSLYSGQMCTAPQNMFIPAEGVFENGELIPFDVVVKSLLKAIRGISEHEKIGPGTLASIQSEQTIERIKTSSNSGAQILLEASSFSDSHFPNSRNSSPAVLLVEEDEMDLAQSECFGPIAIVVKSKSFESAVKSAKDLAAEQGAISCACYCIDGKLNEWVADEMNQSFVPVSFNLEGYIWVNQAAAFSDFHLSGANPAGNASFGQVEFVSRRMVWLGNRYFQKPE